MGPGMEVMNEVSGKKMLRHLYLLLNTVRSEPDLQGQTQGFLKGEGGSTIGFSFQRSRGPELTLLFKEKSHFQNP
jgi:hypothetical protein